jgi:response regulator NasT
MRLINQAKWQLIVQNQMTEAEAHRYIEKQAMDTRQSKWDVALEILKKPGSDAK